jgi:hypothetical protein
MSGRRKAIVSVPFALLLPLAVLTIGMLGSHVLRRVLWAPAERTRDALHSLCSGAPGSSLVCPYSQGEHNQLFFTSFYLVYLAIGLLIIALVLAFSRRRTEVVA